MSIDSRLPTEDSPQVSTPPRPAPPAERPSTLRIVASALAAMTTTFLLSTLGVAGTIVGAAIASVVTVLANFVYVSSLSRTADRVAATVPIQKARSRFETRQTTVLPPVDDDATSSRPAQVQPAPDLSASQRTGVPHRAAGRLGWRRIAGASGVLFLLVLAGVTVVELTAGKPLTDVVRQQEGSGTSLFGSPSGSTAPALPAEVDPGAVEVGEQPPAEDPVEDPATAPTTPEEPTEQPTVPEEPLPTPSPEPPAPGDGPGTEPVPTPAPVPTPEPTPPPTPQPTPSS